MNVNNNDYLRFRRVIYIDAKILGSWNTKCGKRVSVYKFFFNKSKMKCLEGEHEYCVLRKKYVHPFANPPNSVRKVIWLVRRFDKTYYRFLSLNRFYEYLLFIFYHFLIFGLICESIV